MGWLELGNLQEARNEWGQIGDAYLNHPEVLEVSWQIHAMAREWQAALKVAERIRQILPESPAGWICQSFSLHEMKRTQEAWDRLLPVVSRFEEEGTIPYNLACYACQLGQLEDAQLWLKRAIEIKPKFKRQAKNDPDLEPLRGVLGKL